MRWTSHELIVIHEYLSMPPPPIKISSFREEKLAATRDVPLGVKENKTLNYREETWLPVCVCVCGRGC